MKPDETVGCFKPSTYPKPIERSEVRYVYHVTHIEFALDMIKDVQLDSDGKWRCKVHFVTSPSRKVHNERLPAGRHLLFFGCDLGEGWSKQRSRYGNVRFKFLLEDVLKAFASGSKFQVDKLRFYAMGTTVYKTEHSHKVLVTTPNDSESAADIFPELSSLKEDRNKFVPLRCDERGVWSQINSVRMDQMEFVFLFNAKTCEDGTYQSATLQLSGEFDLCAHDDICIPTLSMSSKIPAHCGVGKTVYVNNGKTCISHHSYERSDAEDAKAEIAAAVFCERKRDLQILYDNYRDLLEERVKKITRQYPRRTCDPNYALIKKFPKFHYTLRYYEETSNTDSGSASGSATLPTIIEVGEVTPDEATDRQPVKADCLQTWTDRVLENDPAQRFTHSYVPMTYNKRKPRHMRERRTHTRPHTESYLYQQPTDMSGFNQYFSSPEIRWHQDGYATPYSRY